MPTTDNEPGNVMAFPMMRGFPCPVTTPMIGESAPQQGMGVGWSNVAGQGVQFAVTIHAEGGFAMCAQLDYARYNRLCHNLAAVGRQALLTGKLDETAPNDPLHALGVALEAMEQAQTSLRARLMHNQAASLTEPIAAARAALFLEPKGEANAK